MQRMLAARAVCRWGLVLAMVLSLPAGILAEEEAGPEGPLSMPRRLYLQGNYAEAAEQYTGLLDQHLIAAALGLARCQSATGELDEAGKTLEDAVAKLEAGQNGADAARLFAALARLAFDRGDYEAAGQHVGAALKQNENCLPARWLAAELLRVAGQLDAAQAGYKWLYDFYNADAENQITDPDDVRAAGLAVAELARWERRHQDFGSLVNDLYPYALLGDPDYWPAHYESGLLFLEKFNQAEATASFQAALKINSNAAEVHAALARLALQNFNLDEAALAIDRALEINPRLTEAYCLKSDMLAANFQLEEALAPLEEARRLNPVSEETLGRVAALYVALDGTVSDVETRYGKLAEEVAARNPQCGQFYYTLGERLVELRKYPAAEQFYQQAIERMPRLVGPQAGLGMLYMRLGREVEAQQLLTEAFDIDPAHVRVKNFLEVLDVLSGYAVIETEHFVVKFDRGQDELLARYSARYLEDEVYPVLTQQFGFEPEGKSLFEIFNKAKNTTGHGWFSARMVGLPSIGTVGACAGKIVAMTSPGSLDQGFNWARVLKHEFVHVLNLQQTGFNIPHWYTEALATLNERYPRPQEWNEMLAVRVPKGELFNLETINLGFIRPSSSLDWSMAYCQAELYAEYMLQTYGDDALARMLAAYADNLNTRDGLKRAFNVEQADFEAGYLEHLKQVVSGLSQRPKPPQMTFAELDKAHRADPENADLSARLAQAWFARKSYPKARELANAALKVQPKHQLASYVLARVHLVVGEEEEALALLEGCLDPAAPDDLVLDHLARTRLKAKEFAEAARLYELGAQSNPQDSRWLKGLARVWLTAKDDEKLAPILAQLTEMDADDVTLRKKLAQIALAAGDHAAAATWANQALQIDVLDLDAHRVCAEALVGQEKFAAALDEYDAAVQLQPQDLKLRLALAKAGLQAEQPARARAALEAVLKQSPDHEEARALLEGLSP